MAKQSKSVAQQAFLVENAIKRVHKSKLPAKEKRKRSANLLAEMTIQMQKDLVVKKYPRLRTLTACAKLLGVRRYVLEQWIVDDPEFRTAMINAHEEMVDLLEARALREATRADSQSAPDMLKFFLRSLRPLKYRENLPISALTMAPSALSTSGEESPTKQRFTVGGQTVDF